MGYGLEGAIPDAEAARIIREVVAPRFREGKYAAGLEAAAKAIYGRVEGKPPAERRGTARGQRSRFPFWGVVGFFAILAVIAIMLLREAATTRGLSGSGYTAGGRRGWGVPPIIMLPPMGGRRRDDDDRGGGFGGFGGFGGGGGGGFGGGGASGDW